MNTLLKTIAFAAAAFALTACATTGATSLNTGDWVLARWTAEDAFYYPAVVTGRDGDALTLQYDDGDTGVQPAQNVRRFDWTTGSRVNCQWSNGQWYPARIAQMNDDRYNIHVLFDDGDKNSTNTSTCRSQ